MLLLFLVMYRGVELGCFKMWILEYTLGVEKGNIILAKACLLLDLLSTEVLCDLDEIDQGSFRFGPLARLETTIGVGPKKVLGQVL